MQFTTTNAAKDVGELIERARSEGQTVVVWGASYGTVWTQRYIQHYPDQPDGVSMMGIAPPTFDFSQYDVLFAGVARSYLARCGLDPFCQAKLGADLAATVGQILECSRRGTVRRPSTQALRANQCGGSSRECFIT